MEQHTKTLNFVPNNKIYLRPDNAKWLGTLAIHERENYSPSKIQHAFGGFCLLELASIPTRIYVGLCDLLLHSRIEGAIIIKLLENPDRCVRSALNLR